MGGPDAPTLDMAALDAIAPTPMAAFEQALSAVIANDSTGTGNGTINWTLADLPVFLRQSHGPKDAAAIGRALAAYADPWIL